MKIAYITGTRADYGLMRETLLTINSNSKLDLEIIATGMHLMPKFGETVKEIIQDGFKPIIVDAEHKKDNRESMVSFFSTFSQGVSEVLKKQKIDLVLLLGDRAEMLAGAISATYLGIPIAHIHGGERSGHVDDAVRHAITKLAHIHFPATKESAKRIKRMGEEKDRIFVVGAPGLVNITKSEITEKELYTKLKIPQGEDFIIVVEHPVSTSQEEAEEQIKNIIEAAKETNKHILILYPNADSGGRGIISVINKYKNDKKIHIFKHLKRNYFKYSMNYAKTMIGNSSSGIIEAASFKLPVINIGERQRGRQQSSNTINSDYQKASIKKAFDKIKTKEFQNKLNKCINIYGDGKTNQRITKILSELKINKKILDKKNTF